MHGLDDHMRQGIDNCSECHEVCLQTTITYCLEQGGKQAEAGHIRLMLDCAAMCQTCADFMLRQSAFHEVVCATCAEICEACADDCASFADDEVMTHCAEVCRRCAASCREMSGTKARAASGRA